MEERFEILERGDQPPLAYCWSVPEAQPTEFAILYLHGFASDQAGEKASFFRRASLAAGIPFLSFDFQGHGRSGGSLRELTLSRNLADAAAAHALLCERGFRKVVVVGSSMGAFTGLWHSTFHQDEVLAGLYIAPAVAMADGFLRFAGPERAVQWERDGVLTLDNGVTAAEFSWELIEDFRRFSAEELRLRYQTPALILQGRLDPQVPWREVVNFATGAATKEIELHLFADGDHRLADRKEHLWELMLGFLRARGWFAEVDRGRST